ncbi:hypothetical protein [Candidatus Nitrotoga sp. 1052]|uniref:hypothetical protein n=1 Tax=Candidatus Nitrotoga sp. 1052 TaxID=2886964 RepID=UPI001EF6B261|nr:hypothetical protein [Candidatus Nitrotoga sp. 1052]
MKTIYGHITPSSLFQLPSRFLEKVCRTAVTVYRGTDDSIPYYCMWLEMTGQAWATVQVVVKGTSKNPIFRGSALRLACLPNLVTIRRHSKKLSLTYQPNAALKFLLVPCLVWKLEFLEAPLTAYSKECIL